MIFRIFDPDLTEPDEANPLLPGLPMRFAFSATKSTSVASHRLP
jgi:hypothetical protein